MSERWLSCRKCGRDLPESGRPRSYCSVGCRRAAEFEVRRLQKALESTEGMIRQCRFGWNCLTEDDIPKYAAEVERLEARLREELDDGESS